MTTTGTRSQQLNHHWRQMELLPPNGITVEIVCHLDASTGTATIGTTVKHTSNDEWCAADTQHGIDFSQVERVLVEQVRDTIRYEVNRFNPF